MMMMMMKKKKKKFQIMHSFLSQGSWGCIHGQEAAKSNWPWLQDHAISPQFSLSACAAGNSSHLVLFQYCASQRTGKSKERERDRDWLIGEAFRTHATFIKFTILDGHGSRCPRTIVMSKITDHYSKDYYSDDDDDGKAWNNARTTKMWYRDTKWAKAVGKLAPTD